MATDFLFLEQNDPELARAFDRLKAAEGDVVALNPRYNETWQYMGTSKLNGGWGHEFRHRAHPQNDSRVLRTFPATTAWQPRS